MNGLCPDPDRTDPADRHRLDHRRFWLRKRRQKEAEAGAEDGLRNGRVAFSRSCCWCWCSARFLFEPFKIPSGSMIPTLLIGDFIVVNKYSYGLRLPVRQQALHLEVGEPERGDVSWSFRYPEDERINYIKRVIGLPGDTITYRNKVLFINGEPVVQDNQGSWVGEGINRNPAGRASGTAAGASGRGAAPDPGHPERPDREVRSWTVPEGHYFVLGDNRDQSLDSRAWGFVPEGTWSARRPGSGCTGTAAAAAWTGAESVIESSEKGGLSSMNGVSFEGTKE
jgi:signal peptidase I